MRSSRTITLFTLQPEARRSPSALVASVVLHSSAIALVLFAFIYSPQFRLRTPDVYMMQHVSLNMPYPPIQKAGGSGGMYPKSSSSGEESPSEEKIAAPASSRIHFMRRKLAPQTLINPEIDPEKMLPKETPVPAMLLWSGHRPKIQMLTPPKPQPSNIKLDKPKLNFPNKETHIAQLDISPTPFTSKLPMPMPSKSSPVILNRQLDVERIPETGSVSQIEATPAAVLSASDLHMTQGVVSMPAANQSAEGTEKGGLGTGKTPNAITNGTGESENGTDKSGGKGQNAAGNKSAGPGSGAQKGSGTGTGRNGTEASTGNGRGSGHNAGSGSGPANGHGAGSGDGSENGTVTRINLPKNGQFNVVVVGSSLEEQYPETSEVWKGRLAYSVYLKVGLDKSWILQYSLPRAADSSNAGSAHLEAPWPFYIVRPNLNPDDATSDSVMVHGFVNEAGHFEKLSVVFPTDMGYAREQLVLNALQQWQFRAGNHDGQVAKLEVLLIIPEITQ
ncbi:MAG TPA: hypothetical protein VGF82_27125 [Terracidiphilus sp.]|jgi:hypothetical protein